MKRFDLAQLHNLTHQHRADRHRRRTGTASSTSTSKIELDADKLFAPEGLIDGLKCVDAHASLAWDRHSSSQFSAREIELECAEVAAELKGGSYYPLGGSVCEANVSHSELRPRIDCVVACRFADAFGKYVAGVVSPTLFAPTLVGTWMLLPSMGQIAIGCDWYSVCVVRVPNFVANISVSEILAIVWSYLDDEAQSRLLTNLLSASSTDENPRCVSPSSPFFPSLVQLLQVDTLQRLGISPTGEAVPAVPLVAGDHVVVVGRDMDSVRQLALTLGGAFASISKLKEACVEEGDLRSDGVQVDGLRVRVTDGNLSISIEPDAYRDLTSRLSACLPIQPPCDSVKRTLAEWAWSQSPGMPTSAESIDVAKRIISAAKSAGCSTYLSQSFVIDTIANVRLRWSRFVNSLDHRALIGSVVEPACSAPRPQPVATMQTDPAIEP